MKIIGVPVNPVVNLPAGNAAWHTGTLCGFDTETSEVDTASARIVSASLITDMPGSDPLVNEWLLNPGAPIDLAATAIHGINNEHAEKFGIDAASGIAEIIDALDAIEHPIVVVNGAFDFSILVNEALRYGLDATPLFDKLRIIDTLICDRMLDPYRPGRRTLTAVAASYGIAIKGAHQATGDVLCALRLARAIGRKFPEFGTCDLTKLQTIQADAYRKWAVEFQDYRRMDDDPTFTVPTDWPYRIAIPI